MGKFSELFKEADKSFNQNYSEQLEQLRVLAEEEKSRIISNTTDKEVYDKLIKTIDEATNKNLSQAEIISKIRDLGAIAINLAKKISGLKELI